MTKGQLINALKDYPDTMDVYLKVENDEFMFAYADKVEVKEITLSENPDGSGESCKEEVIIISDL